MGLHKRYARLMSDASDLFTVGHNEEAEELRRQLSDLFSAMMKSLHRSQGARFSVEILAEPAVRSFIDKHAAILDTSFDEVDMSATLRDKLSSSNWVFSGMKTFHELNEAFPELTDENGVLKPFERFLNDVRRIDRTYNSNYLRAEYNFVTASARMAAKWERFERDGDAYNLQYRTQADGRVRPEHAALNGVTLPPSDPFWQDFYPPNGWNCRCNVVQVRKSKYPQTDPSEALALGEGALQKDTKRMFRFNPGSAQKTVPDYNPYTISRCKTCNIAKGKLSLARITPPDNQVCEACRWLHECRFKDNSNKKGTGIPPEKKDEILSLPRDEQFTVEYQGKEGRVHQHLLVCEAAEDRTFVLNAAKAFADMEGDIWINPEIRIDSPMRSIYYYDLPENSRCNPDMKSELYGYIDVKSPKSIEKMGRNAINASVHQNSCVCFTDHRIDIDMDIVHRRTNLLFKDPNYRHDYIFWLIGGKLYKYKRP